MICKIHAKTVYAISEYPLQVFILFAKINRYAIGVSLKLVITHLGYYSFITLIHLK